jgi:hypothetical protein
MAMGSLFETDAIAGVPRRVVAEVYVSRWGKGAWGEGLPGRAPEAENVSFTGRSVETTHHRQLVATSCRSSAEVA